MKTLMWAAGLGALTAALIAGPAAAVVVEDCEGVATVENIAEPWEVNSKSFYQGEVRLAVVDTGGEPACCSTHLMVLYTEDTGEEPPYRACKLVSDQPQRGFGDVDFKHLVASYDPATGLTFSVPVAITKPDGDGSTHAVAKLRLKLKPTSLTVLP